MYSFSKTQRVGTMLLVLMVGSAATPGAVVGQVMDAPVGVGLQHMLNEHVEDRRAVVVLDRFPHVDLIVEIATSAGHRTGLRDEVRQCRGQISDREWECWIAADADVLVELVQQESSPSEQEIRLIFSVSEEMGEAPSRRIYAFQRILTLERSEGGWVVVSDEPGIKS